MSDDSSNDSPDKRPQRVSSTRHWRQRFQGLDGDYIYRKAMNIRGKDGEIKRVGRGDPVDLEGDRGVARRLKALWYAEAIELADPTQQYKPRKVGFRDNLAVRQTEAKLQAGEDATLKAKRDERRKRNELRREEARLRKLAEQAVCSAEERERRELADLIAEEEHAKRAAEIEKRVAETAEKAVADADAERELAAEEAQVAREREAVAQERQEQAEREAGEQRAKLEQESAERAQKREAELAKNVTRFDERPAPERVPNPKTEQVDANAQREEILGKRAGDKE